jgi:hypothetical protein
VTIHLDEDGRLSISDLVPTDTTVAHLFAWLPPSFAQVLGQRQAQLGTVHLALINGSPDLLPHPFSETSQTTMAEILQQVAYASCELHFSMVSDGKQILLPQLMQHPPTVAHAVQATPQQRTVSTSAVIAVPPAQPSHRDAHPLPAMLPFSAAERPAVPVTSQRRASASPVADRPAPLANRSNTRITSAQPSPHSRLSSRIRAVQLSTSTMPSTFGHRFWDFSSSQEREPGALVPPAPSPANRQVAHLQDEPVPEPQGACIADRDVCDMAWQWPAENAESLAVELTQRPATLGHCIALVMSWGLLPCHNSAAPKLGIRSRAHAEEENVPASRMRPNEGSGQPGSNKRRRVESHAQRPGSDDGPGRAGPSEAARPARARHSLPVALQHVVANASPKRFEWKIPDVALLLDGLAQYGRANPLAYVLLRPI